MVFPVDPVTVCGGPVSVGPDPVTIPCVFTLAVTLGDTMQCHWLIEGTAGTVLSLVVSMSYQLITTGPSHLIHVYCNHCNKLNITLTMASW